MVKVKTKVSTNVIIGILLVIIAIGYIGNVFEVWHFTLFFPGWWTLFIIVPSIVALAANGFKKGYVIWLAAGVLLLVKCLGIIPDWLSKLLAPVLILAFGLMIIFRGKIAGENGSSYLALFAGRTPNYNGKSFEGACCTAIFGGVDLKLGQADVRDGAVIDALTVFGGVDVILPPEVNVEVSCLPIFGGISEPKNRVYDESFPTVRVNAVCIFGGVSVK